MQVTVIYEKMHKVAIMIPTQHKLLKLANENTNTLVGSNKDYLSLCFFIALMIFVVENYQQ